METYSFFPYSWHTIEDEEDITSIRIYGLNEENENVCVRIDDFTPYVYVELPPRINWTAGKAQLLGNKIDELMKNKKPLRKVLTLKKRLYGANLDDNGEYKYFPYLLCTFANKSDIRMLSYKIRTHIHVIGLGALKLKIHESDASEILQLVCCGKISTANWIRFRGKRQKDDKITLCDHEFKVSWKRMGPLDNDSVPNPKIMSYDIEANSTNPTTMPNPSRPGDKVFQISCVFYRYGESPDQYIKHLITLGDPDPSIVGANVIIHKCETESILLETYTKLIRQENPNIIAGYNIFGFDIPYMIERAKLNMCIFDFDKQGFHKYAHAKEKTIKWTSSAYGTQEFQFLDAEGRIFVDLLPLVKRDFKFNNYKLKTIAEYFVGESKDPLSAQGIFKCYRIGTKKNSKGEYGPVARRAMGVCGKYCVQDSALVCLLMDKLQTWIGLAEMAKICNVPIFVLYTQGQQVKVFSQLYKYCMENNIVVEKDAYQVKDTERYVGAHVFPPIPGQYKNVVPFDFAALYPTVIIAYNIDYHTWVPDGVNIPDDKCNVMNWEDHIGCIHDPKVIRKTELSNYINSKKADITKLRKQRDKTIDKLRKKEIQEEIAVEVEKLKPYIKERSEITKTITKYPMCEKRSYRFLKEPKGILPTIIQNLLDARAYTRSVVMSEYKNKLKNYQKGVHDKEISDVQKMLSVLNQRQLSYKISANSMYGAMGVRKGYLPFMPGAMCTTYMGRTNIERVADTITKKFGGKLVYGDTDSNYIHFPDKDNASSEELWDWAQYVADEVTKLFPPPIKLEFEDALYIFFLILSKKRYMYRAISYRGGDLDMKIGKKGVLLARRDNSKFVRDVYEGVIQRIADNVPRDDVIYWILQQINEMFAGCKPPEDFVITKAVGDTANIQVQPFINDKGEKKGKIGDYTVKLLSSNKQEREEQLKKKGATNAHEYYTMCLPAQVQLAEKMKRRGQPVDTGTRIEYIVIDPNNHTEKQYKKIESIDYYKKFSSYIKIDYYYYLKALVNPLDQVLDVVYGKDSDWKKEFMLSQYKFRWKVHHKLLKSINDIFTTKICLNI